MDAPLQNLVALLQDEFERHETARRDRPDGAERALLSLYPSTTGDAAASGAQSRRDGSPGMLAVSPADPDVSGHDRMSTPARALNSTFPFLLDLRVIWAVPLLWRFPGSSSPYGHIFERSLRAYRGADEGA